jgi:hypothetical protein
MWFVFSLQLRCVVYLYEICGFYLHENYALIKMWFLCSYPKQNVEFFVHKKLPYIIGELFLGKDATICTLFIHQWRQ